MRSAFSDPIPAPRKGKSGSHDVTNSDHVLWDVICSNPPYMAPGQYAEISNRGGTHGSEARVDPIIALVPSAGIAALASRAGNNKDSALDRVDASGDDKKPSCDPGMQPRGTKRQIDPGPVVSESQKGQQQPQSSRLFDITSSYSEIARSVATYTRSNRTLTGNDEPTSQSPCASLASSIVENSPSQMEIPKGNTLFAVEIGASEKRFGSTTRKKVSHVVWEKIEHAVEEACPKAEMCAAVRDDRGIIRTLGWLV